MRTLSTNNAAEVDKPVTRPIWLVQIGESFRVSSRGPTVVGDDTFLASGLRVDLRSLQLQIVNKDLALSASFLAGTAGVTVSIWRVYGEGPFVATDLDLMWRGELGPAVVGPTIEARLRPFPPKQTPRLEAAPPTFNHLPPDGTTFVSSSGTVVIQRSA